MKGEDISFIVKIKSTGRYGEVFSEDAVKLDKAIVKYDEETL